ncbi:MAG: choice-of-anchor J domain-containing protein, partial [Bacteroidota bacterium]
MKHCSTCILLSILLLSAASVSGQEVLLAENFNDCEFPGDWTVTLNGNTDAVWFVGTTENENADGSSIDGSCMLIFDDDATGENTPAWDVELLSPTFDATGWATVQLSMDVHFRNYNGSAQLEIIVFDGTDFQRVSVYQGGAAQTGEQFSAFTTLTADLSFFANETMRIGIRYNDGNDWAWWAGIDNIQVVGSGTATPILLESFNDCGLPEGWVSEVVGGNAAWEFGLIEDNDETQGVTSMNGSCFAFFDDDGLGQEADPSRALLLTPVLDGLAYANYYLQMDVILRRFTDLENLSIGVFNVATGEIAWVVSYLNDIAGPLFNQYQTEVIDLSAYRQAQMRVVLSYDDGNDWGWWVGIDNLKILGEGVANDICTNAVAINLDASCLPANNRNTLYTGNDVACSTENEGALWYRYTATTTQLVQLQTNARYNDAISVFSGSDCTQLQEVDCTNYDEFGFTGEDLFWQTEANTTYFIRVAGHKGSFGVTRGEHCIQLLSASTLPERPTNDWCVDAQALNIGATCVVGNNRHADFDGPQSSRTDKSKADIWYTFETTTTTPLEIITNADFADVITVFTGNCENLEEVATQELGQRLLQEEISAGQTYFIQVSGYFATLEGSLCIEIQPKDITPPDNDICTAAIELEVGATCEASNNTGAIFSGPLASCAVYQNASIWYWLEAPASGKAVVETNADFIHAVSAYAGTCTNLEEIHCVKNPNRCGQTFELGGLNPGEVYWIRVSSMRDLTGFWQTGALCVRLIDGDAYESMPPLSILGYTECFGNGAAKLVV